jgi:hypothetical protein
MGKMHYGVLSVLPAECVSNREEPTFLLPYSSLVLLVLFARLHACTLHVQSEPNQGTTSTQQQTHADMMTLHSLQNVLVVGGCLPFLPGRKASIPRTSFYMRLWSDLASCLLFLLFL